MSSSFLFAKPEEIIIGFFFATFLISSISVFSNDAILYSLQLIFLKIPKILNQID